MVLAAFAIKPFVGIYPYIIDAGRLDVMQVFSMLSRETSRQNGWISLFVYY